MIATQWEYVGDYLMNTIGIGEVHLHGIDLYFHANRPDGKGSDDIRVITWDGDQWINLRNIEADIYMAYKKNRIKLSPVKFLEGSF
jgi:hypothetical protein